MRYVLAGQTDPARRRVFFDLRGADGITPALNEDGGQPQIAVNGGAWADAGIGTLVHFGFGRCYAELDRDTVANPGDIIESRYKGVATAECPGDSVQVTAFDLDAGVVPVVTDTTNAPVAGDFTAAMKASLAALVSGQGSGSVAVDHDYGGADALRLTNPAGAGIGGAAVNAYLASDYDAGRRGVDFVQGRATTLADGRWEAPMLLAPGAYVLVYSKAGAMLPLVVSVTVTS